jgi:hypothetical protein
MATRKFVFGGLESLEVWDKGKAIAIYRGRHYATGAVSDGSIRVESAQRVCASNIIQYVGLL